jgi:hypothetical protein
MSSVTISELSKKLSLSESRIRHYLGRSGAPLPVKESVSLGAKGRTPGKYDLEEFREFYITCKDARKERRW